jgi:pimeloyl-ACP methyl ester carboxylesterase/2-polyprenyl-6-methoxyphenol hydroxylase-like FAD-dependent oxidoreductase
MRRIGEHAVVIGASMAGLPAAAALADAYERVTVVDRDVLPDAFAYRRAIPQGRHAHALLPRGQEHLDALLPGIIGEMVADGAATYAALEEMRLVLGGWEFARAALGRRAISAGRPFIEGHVRRRVGALDNVEVIDGCDAVGLTASAGGERVTGVRLLRRADGSAEETLAADLVVAATGRAARVPAWLGGLGYPAPEEERLPVDVRYATRHVRLAPGALNGDRMVLIGAHAGRARALFLFAQEHGGWILGLGGYGPAHRPPSDDAGFDAFAASVAPPDVYEAIRTATPLDEISTLAFPAGVRRRYERLRRFPRGLLVCGDAVCSFNPLYGQGMTVAAAQAVALRDCLERGEDALARRFFAAAAEPVEDAWSLAVGADLGLPEVPGPRPARVRAVNAYLRRLQAVAAHDPEVASAFSAVIAMLERPPSVMRPGVVARVARGRRRPVGVPSLPASVRRGELVMGGVRTPLREAGPADAREAVVFLHGNPGSGADWEALLAAVGRGGRRAVAWDAPGFGRATGAADFPQTVADHAAFIGRALDALGIERAWLVGHDFGGPWGLAWAAENPERFAGAVLLGTGVTPGYRWHALARVWRTPVVGELFMATTTRLGFRTLLRRGDPRGLPRAFVDRMYDDFDRDTRRAVLRLYRSVPDVAAAGAELAAALRPLDRPALVLWGRHDPYLPVALAARQRDAFPHAQIRVLDGSGHWPFVDDADAVAAAVTAFLDRETATDEISTGWRPADLSMAQRRR